VSSRSFHVARQAHPSLRIDPSAFQRYLAARRPVIDLDGIPIHAADLFLACGALARESTALRVLDDRLQAAVPLALRRLRVADEVRNEVTQRTRERLLVSAPAPKLAEYEGRGALDGWLRAVLLRVALNLLEAEPRGEDMPAELEALAAPGPDPELALVQRSDRATLDAALAEALADIAPRTRHFLALYVLEGLTLEQIGQRMGTHKSTVSRALAAARGRVLIALRRRTRGAPDLDVSALFAGASEQEDDFPSALHRVLSTVAG
jgi:RNA polymerase sigma-70 factor (ECF subfamily)